MRAFGAVGGTPLFAASGCGPRLRDAEGQSYIDLCCSWGALPLGHAHPKVQAALAAQLSSGLSFGMPTEAENHLAAHLQQALPQLELLRFVNSGTEAVMSALRLARAATGRSLVLKFDGGYHGHADYLLVQAGSGASELAPEHKPSSTGVPPELAGLCRSVPYNDLAAAERLLSSRQIAAVIVEPIAANMGLILPQPGFLSGLRRACDRHGSLLVFDEVITGFRLPTETGTEAGSAATYYDLQPDLSCFGKAIGGGLPLAAYGGRRELMRQLAPEGDCYQAGTLAGNPLAAVGGLATLQALNDPSDGWQTAYSDWQDFICRLQSLLEANGSALAHCGSLLAIYPAAQTVLGRAPQNFAEARRLAAEGAYAPLFHFLLQRGVYLSPSPYEALFLSTAHRTATLKLVLEQIAAYFAVPPRYF